MQSLKICDIIIFCKYIIRHRKILLYY